jgi:hypothetical protein
MSLLVSLMRERERERAVVLRLPTVSGVMRETEREREARRRVLRSEEQGSSKVSYLYTRAPAEARLGHLEGPAA